MHSPDLHLNSSSQSTCTLGLEVVEIWLSWKQFASSLLSEQSPKPSHCHFRGMHFLLLRHSNISTPQPQFDSSSPKGQSTTPLHLKIACYLNEPAESIEHFYLALSGRQITLEADSHLKASSAHSISVVFASRDFDTLQPISSLPSPQSFCPSHSNCLSMHWPLVHWKSSSEHFSFSTQRK
jgi:hypothetical protein